MTTPPSLPPAMDPEHFNKLTPAEAESLALLIEECGEVIQAVGKIQRHGYESYNPDRPEKGSNRAQLEAELGDLRAAVVMMLEAGDVEDDLMEAHARAKKRSVKQYLHHQEGTTK